MALRVSKKEKQEIQRLRRNAQAKIRRLANLGVDSSYFPEVPKLSAITTRPQLNQTKAQLKRFTSRYVDEFKFVKTEKGVYINRLEFNAFRKEQKRASNVMRKIDSRYDNEAFKILSEKNPTTTRTVGQDRLKEPVKYYTRSIHSFNSIEEFKAYMEKLSKVDLSLLEKLDQNYQDNYIRALIKVYGDDAKRLIAEIQTMNAEDFVKKAFTVDAGYISYIYRDEERQQRLSGIESYFIE